MSKENLWLRIRKWISVGEWKAGLLGFSKSQGSSSEPGLIMIQIDGLPMSEFEEAIANDEMPFLKKLLTKEQYKLYPHYPGLPSTTPAVQGELMYGVKQAVPAFFFLDKGTRKIFKMFNGDSVREMERRLSCHGKGLLEGGSSYSNIYSGGAAESHFCASSLGWDKVWKDVNLLNLIILLFTHLLALVRMTLLSLWEIVLAVMDCIHGLLKKEDPAVEFKFVPIRVLLCVLLRELITLGVTIDAARGLPVIHLNFIGYDEQAHRRTPSSRTAHWALKGIDASIARIYRAALNSSRRHYDVWIYSDHGQEETVPYVVKYKKTVEEAVAGIFNEMFPDHAVEPVSMTRQYARFPRVRYLGKWIEKIWPLNHHPEALNAKCVTAAMGPLGHVYVFHEMSRDEKNKFAFQLVKQAKIPLVLTLDEKERVQAWNEKGTFLLPECGGEVLDAGHPFYNDVIEDLMALARNPNAGTFVISGWRKNGKPLSFPFENGAHAGPGPEETRGFALLPSDILTPPAGCEYVRIGDLRNAALRLLKPAGMKFSRIIPQDKNTIRLMTYNVHSCIGTDGKVSPRRIARVIARYQPDIVALQELDLSRPRTNHDDQPHLIAKELEMMYHFHPAIQVEQEQYGNAVLSRYPMDLVCAMKLPVFDRKLNLEPRGALWVSVQIGDIRLQLINAHLSFFGPECEFQADALMSPEWIGHINCAPPIIVCGDFNCLPNSTPWNLINQKLKDAQLALDGHRPLATWFGHYPVSRIDHVFISDGSLRVKTIDVPQTDLNKMASDHLPLIVDLEII